MANVDTPAELPAPTKESGGSLVKLIAVLVLMTVVAAGLGGGLGVHMAKEVEDAVKQKESAKEEAEPSAEPRYAGPTHLKPLPPILTNLGDPRDVWIRIEASLVFDDEAVAEDEVLTARISEDILAYLRTVSLPQIEGPSGMQHLREDLDERARLRSEGRVSEIVIHTLVIQ